MNGPYDIYTDGDTNEDMPDCTFCGAELDWCDCPDCGGDGYFDWETLQEEDPLWYQPGDTERCDTCKGEGGWLECPFAGTHELIVQDPTP